MTVVLIDIMNIPASYLFIYYDLCKETAVGIGAVGSGNELQAGRSRGLFPMD